MRWEDERYVRLYTRDTATWKLLPWQGRALLPLLLRKADRRGLVDVDGDRVEGVAALVDLPLEVVGPGLAGLLARGVVAESSGGLTFPRFVEAQEARASDRMRAQDYRARKTVTVRDAPSRDVTRRHASTDDTSNNTADRSPDNAAAPVTGSAVCDDTSKTVTVRDEASRCVTDHHDSSHGVTRHHTASQRVTPSLAEPSLSQPPNPPVGSNEPTEPPPSPGGEPTSPKVEPEAPKPTPRAEDPKPATTTAPSEADAPKRPTKAQRRKAAIAASQSLLGLEPAEGTLAWRVWKAIRGSKVLDAITDDAAGFAEAVCADGAYPGVDVLAVVQRSAEWASRPQNAGKYTDGRRYLSNALRRASDEATARGGVRSPQGMPANRTETPRAGAPTGSPLPPQRPTPAERPRGSIQQPAFFAVIEEHQRKRAAEEAAIIAAGLKVPGRRPVANGRPAPGLDLSRWADPKLVTTSTETPEGGTGTDGP